MERFKGYLLVVIGIVIGSIISGVSDMVSAHNSGTALVHACVAPNGSIFVVGENQTCNPNQTALDWAIQGVPGPAGATGAAGAQGPIGPAGPQGPVGLGYFVGTDLSDAYLSDADLFYVNLAGFNFAGADLSQANLLGANLTGANLSNTDLTEAVLSNTNLTGADLSDAELTRAFLTNANLTNANLTGAYSQPSLYPSTAGIIYSNTICPDGTNSNNHDNTCSGANGMP